MVQGRTEFSRAHGERAAVGLEYRKLGLKNRPGNHDPFDALVSELDFLSYVTSLEARAFEGGDAGSAREWERLRLDFCTHHFGELARGSARALSLSLSLSLSFSLSLSLIIIIVIMNSHA